MKKNQQTSNGLLLTILLIASLFITGCAGVTISRNSPDTNQPALPKLTFAKDDNFVVLITDKDDSLASLAKQHLGNENKDWIIADFNEITRIEPNREIVIPLQQLNNTGITIHGIQTIPILCYHRFGSGHSKMAVSTENFKQQMQYLEDNNFNVIPLKKVYDFLENKEPLPKKSVVITIDDGYRSTYETAFPILKSFDFPATLFLYTNFTGARDAVTWKQVKKMSESGLIDIQPHSKTHPNMSLLKTNESQGEYKKRILKEINAPEAQIRKRLNGKIHTFAYPYGDTNSLIIEILTDRDYKLGVTVQPGGNSAFSHPYMLRRTMIFGNQSMSDFKKTLITFQDKKLK